jgi:two-component system, NarL family, response regulator NreC
MLGVLRSEALLVDDHPLFRAGLAATLSREPDLRVTAEASTGSAAIDTIRNIPVDVAIVDVMMPTGGAGLTRQLQQARPSCKILALSVLDEPSVIASMLRAGATGYALKTQTPSEITDAVRAVLAGVRYLPPVVSGEAVSTLMQGDGDEPLRRLTRREREVFDLLIRGRTNDEIANRLFIAKRTVETHRQHVMKKLATHSLLEMIRLAARQGALAD